MVAELDEAAEQNYYFMLWLIMKWKFKANLGR